MKFSEMANRITGVSCPIFGISWNPPEMERDIARHIIVFLEGRRVLFAAMGDEALCSSQKSITEIRNELTSALQQMKEDSQLNTYARAMRKACNKFLSTFPDIEEDKCRYCRHGNHEYWIFVTSIGEFRALFGIMIGQMSKAFGLDVEDDLAQIIPE